MLPICQSLQVPKYWQAAHAQLQHVKQPGGMLVAAWHHMHVYASLGLYMAGCIWLCCRQGTGQHAPCHATQGLLLRLEA